jgi:hypothetical protein
MLGLHNSIAPPGNVPIWPHENELALVQASNCRVVDVFDPKGDLPSRKRIFHVFDTLAFAEGDKDKSLTIQVKGGATIGEPSVWRPRAWPGGRNVDAIVVGRGRRAIGNTYRGVLVTMPNL